MFYVAEFAIVIPMFRDATFGLGDGSLESGGFKKVSPVFVTPRARAKPSTYREETARLPLALSNLESIRAQHHRLKIRRRAGAPVLRSFTLLCSGTI